MKINFDSQSIFAIYTGYKQIGFLYADENGSTTAWFMDIKDAKLLVSLINEEVSQATFKGGGSANV